MCQRPCDNSTFFVYESIGQQFFAQYKDKEIDEIIGHIFFPFLKGIKAITGHILAVIPPNDGIVWHYCTTLEYVIQDWLYNKHEEHILHRKKIV